MTKTATKAGGKTLAEQIGEARQNLDRLSVEMQELPGRLRQASYDGDAVEVVALRRRHDELPDFLAGARLRVERLTIAHYEQQLERARVEVAEAEAAMAEPERVFEQAKDALFEVRGTYQMALTEMKSLETDLQVTKSRLSTLVGAQDTTHGDAA